MAQPLAKKEITYDVQNLNDLIKSLKEDYTLRIGIIGAKAKQAGHKNSSKTNAEIGTFHEFGTKKMSRRSFLEDSLKLKLKFNTEKMREMRRVLFEQFFIKKAPQKFLQDLGAKCLMIIEDGFATNGFGRWKPYAKSTESNIAKKNKVLTMEKAKNARLSTYRKASNFWTFKNILTDTGKLRHSIAFKIFKKK